MAARVRASKVRNASSAIEAAPDLLEFIEEERDRLMQAESLLECVLVALDAEDGATDSAYFPSVIAMARELMGRSIDRLDSIRLRPLLAQARGERNYETAEEKTGTYGTEVKESADVHYLY